MEVQATDREENKQIALGTSKLNYLDPRISVAWYFTLHTFTHLQAQLPGPLHQHGLVHTLHTFKLNYLVSEHDVMGSFSRC